MAVEFEKELGTMSFDGIVDYTLQAIIQKDVGISNVNPGSVLRTLVEVFAENEDIANYYIEYVYKCMDIDNCYGDDLDRSVKILGLVRETAKSAVGEITLYTGDNPAEYDIEIPYGTIVSTRPNRDGEVTEFYISDANRVIEAGQYSINVAVTCTEPGLVYIPAGAIDVLAQSLQGVDSIVNQNIINGGRDIESDEEFRERIRNIRETFGKCTDEAIRAAVNEVSGVTGVNVVDRYNGIGTTGVIVVTDVVPPPESVKNDIETVIANVKASGIKAFVIYTDIVSADVEIEVTNILESDYQAIAQAVNSYCLSLNAGQPFIIKQMERKVLNAVDKTEADNDDVDITTIRPISNIMATAEQIIRPLSIKINGQVISIES